MKALPAAAILALALAGCARQSPYVGTYDGKLTLPPGGQEMIEALYQMLPPEEKAKYSVEDMIPKMELELKADNTYEVRTSFQDKTETKKGKWTADEKANTLTVFAPEGEPKDSETPQIGGIADEMTLQVSEDKKTLTLSHTEQGATVTVTLTKRT